MDLSKDVSPGRYARIGGWIYLLIIIAALFGEVFARGGVFVLNDPEATARNLLHSELQFRLGIALEMLTCAGDTALAMILYVLLAPVNRNLALVGAFFRVVFVAFYGITKLFEVAALVLVGDTAAASAFTPAQLHALAYVALRVHGLGYGASLLFFGFCCVVFGHLIQRSRYLPRALGLLLALGGYGYLVFTISQILAPAATGRWLFPWLLLPAFVGELGLALWLLAKGVDLPKWEARS